MIRLINRRLIIPRGDTGTFTVPLIASATAADVAVFTIFNCLTHTKLFQKTITTSEDSLTIEFTHNDTVNLKPGHYVWDIKFYKNPVFAEEELINGDEIDSYYAGFTLPVCEIKETGDDLLLSDDAPTSTMSPMQLNVINSAISETNQSKRDAAASATTAEAAKAQALAAVSEINNLQVSVSTLGPTANATASYNASTGLLSLGIPQGHTISSINKTATNGLVDTYTITFTNGNTTTFNVTNGAIPSFSIGTVVEGANAAATITGTDANPVLNLVLPKANVPKKVSELENDSGYLTQHQDISGKVDKVTGKDLSTNDFTDAYKNKLDNALTSFTETDPTVPSWAKAVNKPTYTAAEVGAPTIAEMQQAIANVNTMKIHVCTSQEYNSETGVPTIVNPDTQTFYLVPGGEGSNLFIEWAYVNNAWERFGSADVDLSNYVQKTDYATADNAGVVKIIGGSGLTISNGVLYTVYAGSSVVKAGTNKFNPIVPFNQNAAVFYGLAKAAGDSTQSASANAVGTYTTEAKAAIQQMLDVPSNSDVSAYATKTDTVLETTLSRGRKEGTTVGTDSFAFGSNVEASGWCSYAEGANTKASGATSHAEGNTATASGVASHAEGVSTVASGTVSHAEGKWNIASGDYSHAEGGGNSSNRATTASGEASHAEGAATIASGMRSHAEGAGTVSSGPNSHAEGVGTVASAMASHAEGIYTKAVGRASHTSGRYNIEDSYSSWSEWVANTEYVVGDKVKITNTTNNETTVTGYICKTANSDAEFDATKWTIDTGYNYAHIVGNGTADNARSNAYALDWDGNGHYAGDIYVHANADSTGGVKVATINDVPVQDVQVNGESVLQDGVAQVPVAGSGRWGVVLVRNGNDGVRMADGRLEVSGAAADIVRAGTSDKNPITPGQQHASTFYGLAKAAGDSTQSASSNAVGTYTDAAKSAIQSMLGISNLLATSETTTASKAYSIGEVFTSNGKLYKATAAIAAADAIVVQNEGETVSGHNAEETSLSDWFVKKTDYATSTTPGIVKINGAGLLMFQGQQIIIVKATDSEIKTGTHDYDPIVPSQQHKATFYGLAKAAGDTTQSASSNAVGTYTADAKAAIRTMLSAVGNEDYASTSTAGVVKVSLNNGSQIINGILTSVNASAAEIKTGVSSYKQVNPGTTDAAAFYGLAKASGDTTQSASSNAVGSYTDSAKASIKSMLGIVDGSTGTVSVSGTTPTITAVENTRYVCGEVATLSITPSVSGICIIRFTSGSTATVLTLPSTVKFPEWFDATALEADTIYELCITDGIYGAVMSWAQ